MKTNKKDKMSVALVLNMYFFVHFFVSSRMNENSCTTLMMGKSEGRVGLCHLELNTKEGLPS